ncbi:MAG: rhodanese-like domain-containing protein [Ignavibacteriales bacterium]|nr:rhodanese-like domain-containing protein [Ignavibacteriaceae bacterium]QOJ27457.1 MAG: rhodanese-like domain-containing protein [Ignavibacteriales bacterium]
MFSKLETIKKGLMKNQKFLFTFIIVAAVSVFFFAQSKPEKNMSVEELKQAMKTDKNLLILDVRTPGELTGNLGQIDGVVNIPVQELETRVKELDKYKGKKIAVICRSGNRSVPATNILLKNGHEAYNVPGGMIAWRNAGF